MQLLTHCPHPQSEGGSCHQRIGLNPRIAHITEFEVWGGGAGNWVGSSLQLSLYQ